jgi:dTDP-4-dehydrorhamnose reductase
LIHTPFFRYYEADLLDEIATYAIFQQEKPNVVVHCAALSKPDECEQNRELSEQINVKATAMITLYAEEYSNHLIFLSTGFVFDGIKGNYSEEDNCNPVSWYGFTKVQAESIVETCEIPYAIIRTCLVYGQPLNGIRNNILSWVVENLQKEQIIKVVNDQWRTPTYVTDIVNGIVQVIEKKATGIFHLSGNEMMTPYDMALATAQQFNLNPQLLEKADAGSFKEPARRPHKTGFIISKAQQQLGYHPISFQEGLTLFFQKSKAGKK